MQKLCIRGKIIKLGYCVITSRSGGAGGFRGFNWSSGQDGLGGSSVMSVIYMSMDAWL